MFCSKSAVKLTFFKPNRQISVTLRAHSALGRPTLTVSLDASTKPPLSIWSLAWPSIAVYLMATLVSLGVMKIVGVLGTPEVSALTAGVRIHFIFQAIVMGLSAGTTALVARAIGAKEAHMASDITLLSLCFSVAFALFMSLAVWLLAPSIAERFASTEQTLAYTITYLRWACVFNINFAIIMVLSSALRAAGDARSPMYIALLTNLLHIGLASALTFGYGNAGDTIHWQAMHLKGTALGTGIAYITGSCLLLYLWITNRLIIRCNRPRVERDVLSRLWAIASPAVLEQAVMQISLLLYLALIARYGDAPFAAYGIGLSILSVTMVVGLGFSISGAALVGQAIGAGDALAARSAALKALKLAALTMTVLGGIVLFFAEPLARFMISDAETVRLTTVFLWVLACVQPFMAVDFAIGGALRGAGDTRFALFATLCTFVGLRVGLAVLLTWLQCPVEYIFATLVVDYAIKAALLIWRYRSNHWLRAINPKP